MDTREDIWTRSDSQLHTRKRRAAMGRIGRSTQSFVPRDDVVWGRPGKIKALSYERGTALDDESVTRYEVRQPTHGRKPSMRYASRTPFPTYSQFGRPTMVDEKGRQYKWGDGSDAQQLSRNGIAVRGAPVINGQNALLYVRFGMGKRESTGFPEPGTELTFYDIRKRVIYKGKVAWIEGDVPPKSATGSVFMEKIQSVGVVDENTVGAFKDAVSLLPKKYQVKI